MKFHFVPSLSVAAAATALFSICAPAHAVSLAGSSDLNSTEGFSFAQDTTVKFAFLESHGEYQSVFGVYDASKNLLQNLLAEVQPSDNGNTNDWTGTCGITVPGPCDVTYTFQAGTQYFLGLASQAAATVFSGTQFNGQLPFTFTNDANTDTTVLAVVNDSYTGDTDYNDFVFSADAVRSVPEPTTVGALLGVGALGWIGRRRQRATR
jgi:hypothetical protein